MPWFKATCKGSQCNFERNFEAEDIEEAQETARVDHKTYSPFCVTPESVGPSSVEKEIYDTNKLFLGPMVPDRRPELFGEDDQD